MSGPGQPGFEPRTRDPERRDFFDLRRRIVLADEVWVGSDPPPADHYELWYDPDAAPVGTIGMVETGDYTPALTSIAIGTGGSAENVAHYVFVGGSEVGDEGILSIEGSIVLGTSGASVSAGTGHAIDLPAGFQHPSPGTDQIIAHGLHRGTGTFVLQGWGNAATTWRPLYLTATPTVAGITNTLPFTWAAGHSMRYAYCAQVVRV